MNHELVALRVSFLFLMITTRFFYFSYLVLAELLAVGSFEWEEHTNSEMYLMDAGYWQTLEDYPYDMESKT